MRLLVIMTMLTACGGGAATPSVPPGDVTALCDSLDRNRCLDSDKCTLYQVAGTQYACRPEVGQCEVGLEQDDQAGCEKRSGCRFEIADCFCACKTYGRTKIEDTSGDDCSCACGGGPPSMCVPSSTPRREDR